MLIRIIEDDDIKLQRIISFLENRFPGNTIQVSLSFQSGLRQVEFEVPEIVILDMALPTFDRSSHSREGRLRPLGGYDLMRKLKLKSINTRVVILTQLVAFGDGISQTSFEEISIKCRNEFPDIFVDCIYFDQGGAQWQDRLAKAIEREITRRGI